VVAAGLTVPALVCGGDWWALSVLRDNRCLLVMGDVTGHGLPSALLTAAAKAPYDVARAAPRPLTLDGLLKPMNIGDHRERAAAAVHDGGRVTANCNEVIGAVTQFSGGGGEDDQSILALRVLTWTAPSMAAPSTAPSPSGGRRRRVRRLRGRQRPRSHERSGRASTPGDSAASSPASGRSVRVVAVGSLPRRPSACTARSQKNVRQPSGRAA